MKKITFTGGLKSDATIASLIKGVNKLTCNMKVDFQNGCIIVENINDTMIDATVELIDKLFSISSVIIDNCDDEANDNIIVTDFEKDSETAVNNQTISSVDELQTSNVTTSTNTKVLDPQSEDDLIINKIEFSNEYIEELVNKFLKTAYWAIYKMGASEKEIGNFIYTIMCEISMTYNSNELADVTIGDIVDVNYGYHLGGETNGNHSIAVVCDITNNDMVYLVPISSNTKHIYSTSTLEIQENINATYYFADRVYNGNAILSRGKYLRLERVNTIIGKVNQFFLIQLLTQLPNAFDFTNFIPKDNVSSDKISKCTTLSSSNEASKKIGTEEATILEEFSSAFEKLDASLTVEEQLDNFLADIQFPPTKMIKNSFLVAFNVNKINFENIISELNKNNPHLSFEHIKNNLKYDFKTWLKKYPTISQKCPKISLTSLIKVFVSQFNKNA